MTARATRDALAEMDGWRYELVNTADVHSHRWEWVHKETGRRQVDHPHPPTLDGADAAVPEGFYWERAMAEWVAYANLVARDAIVKPFARVPDTGDKIADLYALALACRRAMEEKR